MSGSWTRRLGLTVWARPVRRVHHARPRRLALLACVAVVVVPVDAMVGAFAPVVTAGAAAVAGLVLAGAWRWRRRARQLEQILAEELDHRRQP